MNRSTDSDINSLRVVGMDPFDRTVMVGLVIGLIIGVVGGLFAVK